MESPATTSRSLSDYASVAPDDQLEALSALAEDLCDIRVLHLNSTATGGGVAEILHSIVPLSNDLGVDTDWKVIEPDSTIAFLQRESAVVVQKSFREGFGLVVAEALWKETPVIGSNVGGIPLQIEDGKNGYLVDPDDVDGAAVRLKRLLEDGELRRRLGENGRETVRERFLLPRHLLDYLELFRAVHEGTSGRPGT